MDRPRVDHFYSAISTDGHPLAPDNQLKDTFELQLVVKCGAQVVHDQTRYENLPGETRRKCNKSKMCPIRIIRSLSTQARHGPSQ